MSRAIEAIYRNGQIELPPGVQLPENTQVTVIIPEHMVDDPTQDPAYSIPDLAQDIGPEDLAQQFEHYLYGHPKQP